MMRCIVVDDEPLIRELLEEYIAMLPFLKLVSSCKGSREALIILEKESVDLLFVDVEMPFISGINLLQTLNHPPLAIIISAYERYALQGFELNVVDYVVKPFSFERFKKACDRAHDLFLLHAKATSFPDTPDHFYVRVEYELQKIIVDQIVYIEGLKDYIRIYLQGVTWPVLTRMSMKAIEEKLTGNILVRTHKSFLVAVPRITAVKKHCVIADKKEIPLSIHYRKAVIELLK